MITVEDMQREFDFINEVAFDFCLPRIPLRIQKSIVDGSLAVCITYDTRLDAVIAVCENNIISNGRWWTLRDIMLHEMIHLHIYIRDCAHLVGPGWMTKRKKLPRNHRHNGDPHDNEFFDMFEKKDRIMQKISKKVLVRC